jgi:hypothetical protein
LKEFNSLVDAPIMNDWKQTFDSFYSSASQTVQQDLDGLKTVPSVCSYYFPLRITVVIFFSSKFTKLPEFDNLDDFKLQILKVNLCIIRFSSTLKYIIS